MAARIALITGANSGIGFAIAKELAAASESFHTILAGRSLDKVEAAVSEIKATGHGKSGLTALHLDVTDQSSIERAASTVQEKFGRLDVLINNAGIAPDITPDTTPTNLANVFRDTFTTNLYGPVLVSAAFKPLLLAGSNPYSLYIGSETSSLTYLTDKQSTLHCTTAGSKAYRASKSALNFVAMHEQLEVEGTGLKVFIMCPGFVISNLRGTAEEARNAGGRAGDPAVSARLAHSILRGERDDDVTNLIAVDGTHPW